MNFRMLAAFRAVMSAGSVTEASAALGRSQPAVSRAIADLEAHVGYPLFDRVNRRMVPTDEAVLLHEEVERAFQSLDYVDEAARMIGARRGASLHVTAMPAIALSVLPLVAERLSEERPDLRMNLEVRSSGWVLQSVLHRQCDVGLSGMPLRNPGLSIAFVASSPAVCVLPRGHALADREAIEPADLRGERFISLGTQYRLRQQVDHAFREAGVERLLRIETQLSEMACLLVERGLGVAVVDPFMPLLRPNLDVEVRPFHPSIPFEWGAVTQAGRHLAEPAQHFLAVLEDAVRCCEHPKATVDSRSH